MDTDDRALTIKEVAGFLNLSNQMIYNMIREKKLPAFKIGSAVRILHSDLMEYINSRKTEFIGDIGPSLNVEIRDLQAIIGKFQIGPISLDLPAGKTTAVLGPSGSGKTTLLRTIAGLHKKISGSIFLGGKNLDAIPVGRHRIGYVFQDYALFPHMDTEENISFPLKTRNRDPKNIPYIIKKITEELKIDPVYLDKKIDQLPEGIKQLTAIGKERANDVDLFIYDEPMVHLDPHIKKEIRIFIKQIVRLYGKTTIMSLTDPEDALALADYTAIVNEGEIIQFGRTREVYLNPSELLSMEILSPLKVNSVRAEVKNGKTSPFGFDTGLKDGDYDLCFRADEIEEDNNGINVKITGNVFYDSRRSLAECTDENGNIFSLLIPSGRKGSFCFRPVHPVLFREKQAIT